MGIVESRFSYDTREIVRERALKPVLEYLNEAGEEKRISMRNIADKTDYSPRHIARIIEVLENMGVIERLDRTPKVAYRYRVFEDYARERGLLDA